MNNLVRFHQEGGDVQPARYVHIIDDDTTDDEDEDDIVDPTSLDNSFVNRGSHYEDGSYRSDHELMIHHQQQYHHFDPQGRFNSITSNPSNKKVCSGQPLPRLPESNHQDEGQSWDHDGPSLMQTELIAFRKAARMAHTIGSMIIKRQAALINRQLVQLQKQEAEKADFCDVPDSSNKQEDIPFATGPPLKRRRIDVSPITESQSQPYDESEVDDKDHEKLSSSLTSHHEPTAATIQESPRQSMESGTMSCNTNNENEIHCTSTSNTNDAMNIWYQVDRMKRMSLFLTNAQMAQSLMYEEMRECYYENVPNNPTFSSIVHFHYDHHDERQGQDTKLEAEAEI